MASCRRSAPSGVFWLLCIWKSREQLLEVQRCMRQRVWEAAHVRLKSVTLDTDTTVHTLFGQQMGARKGYNPKHKGKKSYQPILTFIAETREYAAGCCATATGPMDVRSPRIWTRSPKAFPQPRSTFTLAPIPASTNVFGLLHGCG